MIITKHIKTFMLFVGLLLFAASCTRYKNMVYLQEGDNMPDSSGFYSFQVPTYKIQKRDVLYIRIISMNNEVTQVINTTPISSTNVYTTDASLYIYGYNVTDSGYVEIPVIGRIEVVDKTLDEAKEAITNQTLKFLKDPTVIVKLISFNVSVLGEVARPGSYQNYNNELTVLEAISQAGDITTYGNRRAVLVIRPSPEGTKVLEVDLTNRGVLKTEGFYLLPNDIVYVEPGRTKNFRNNVPTISLILGAITTFILVLSYVNPPNR